MGEEILYQMQTLANDQRKDLSSFLDCCMDILGDYIPQETINFYVRGADGQYNFLQGRGDLCIETKALNELMDCSWEEQAPVVWMLLPGVGNQMNGSGLYVPLPTEGKDIGVMEILHSEREIYNCHDALFAEVVAGYAGAKIAQNQNEMRVQQYEVEMHDLRTPLAIISGVGGLMSQVIGKYHDADETLDQLVPLVNSMSRGVKRLEAFLKSSSDLMSIAQGEKIQRQIHEIEPWITDLADMYYGLAQEKGINFCLDNHSNGNQMLVDGGLMSKAVMNLINNAFKYTPKGGQICLSSYVMGNKVSFLVSNTGPHIPEQEQSQVIKKGKTIPRGECQEGQGLGLAVAEAVAVGHRGKLTLYSTPEEGTIFNISVPLR